METKRKKTVVLKNVFSSYFNLYFSEALLPGTGIGTGFPTRQQTDLKLVARGSQSLSLASSV